MDTLSEFDHDNGYNANSVPDGHRVRPPGSSHTPGSRAAADSAGAVAPPGGRLFRTRARCGGLARTGARGIQQPACPRLRPRQLADPLRVARLGPGAATARALRPVTALAPTGQLNVRTVTRSRCLIRRRATGSSRCGPGPARCPSSPAVTLRFRCLRVHRPRRRAPLRAAEESAPRRRRWMRFGSCRPCGRCCEGDTAITRSRGGPPRGVNATASGTHPSLGDDPDSQPRRSRRRCGSRASRTR